MARSHEVPKTPARARHHFHLPAADIADVPAGQEHKGLGRRTYDVMTLSELGRLLLFLALLLASVRPLGGHIKRIFAGEPQRARNPATHERQPPDHQNGEVTYWIDTALGRGPSSVKACGRAS